jgi:hypothetical protein
MTTPTMAKWATRNDTHAEQCRQACQGQDAPSDLWLPVNEERFDYSDDGPGALFMMLVCLVLTVGAIAAAFVFI